MLSVILQYLTSIVTYLLKFQMDSGHSGPISVNAALVEQVLMEEIKPGKLISNFNCAV
jgi:hypothetical protein